MWSGKATTDEVDSACDRACALAVESLDNAPGHDLVGLRLGFLQHEGLHAVGFVLLPGSLHADVLGTDREAAVAGRDAVPADQIPCLWGEFGLSVRGLCLQYKRWDRYTIKTEMTDPRS